MMTDLEKMVFAAVYARDYSGEYASSAHSVAVEAVRDMRMYGDPEADLDPPPHPCLGLLESIRDRRLVSCDQVTLLFKETSEFKGLWLQATQEELVVVDHDGLGYIRLTAAGRRLLEDEG